MRLAETAYDNAETGCCARLDGARWDGRELTWQEKPFIAARVHAFLHVPLDYGRAMKRAQRAVEAAAAYPEEPLWLTDETSPWGATLYVAVDRPVPGARPATLSGTFLTQVFEGPYRDAPRWVTAMHAHLAGRGLTAKRILMYYATCPRCAARFGRNASVLFAQFA
jgi:hypothetical protein